MNQINATDLSSPTNKRSRPLSEALRVDHENVLPEGGPGRQLVWSGNHSGDWEILIYRNGGLWEACFFRWAIHHEHAFASSLDLVQQRVEQRIGALEAGRLKSADWKHIIH